MNRSLVAAALLLATLMPSPAFAWFGWLDKFSGAGPFWGLLYDVRVVCFGGRTPDDAAARKAATRAQNAERDFEEHVRLAREDYKRSAWDPAFARYQAAEIALGEATNGWTEAAKQWEALAADWAAFVELGKAGDPLVAQPGSRNPDQRPPQNNASQAEVDALAAKIEGLRKGLTEAKDKFEAQRQKVETYRQINAFALSVGVEVSACQNVKRRSAIDVGVGLWKVLDDSSPYSGDKLTTARTSYNIRIFDVLDYSTGVGIYWVTSTRYDAVRGVFFEPARLHFHAPQAWSGLPFSDWRRIAAVPVLSWGPAVFPSGFKEKAFGANERIKGEAILKNFAVHFSVRPAHRKPKPRSN